MTVTGGSRAATRGNSSIRIFPNATDYFEVVLNAPGVMPMSRLGKL
jgi:hypothetical protein